MGLLGGRDDLIPQPPKGEPSPPPPPPGGGYGAKVVLKGITTASLSAGKSQEFDVEISNTGTEDDAFRVAVELVYGTPEKERAEWTVKLLGIEDKPWDVTFTKIHEKEVRLIGGGSPREIALSVTCPRGVRFGDKLDVIVSATSRTDPRATSSAKITATARPAVLAVKTSIGHERTVADSLAARAKEKDIGVFSILAPATLRGFVFVESMNPDRLEETVRGIRRARGIAGRERSGQIRETTLADIEHFLTPKPIVSGIMEGDIIELVAGPFKGEKARVQKIDEGKEEITVELFEAMVPIPITVRGDSVRVIEKEKRTS